ncbi:MAG: aminotransferase class I/II-fold pyridoxal phosphate-dependent enzyme [Thermoguttaceae bacterium]|nr:aminotransferase class I/II-fold pyridoxal phosphate-dependent enzyme [Thermoguttaceae bacterium]
MSETKQKIWLSPPHLSGEETVLLRDAIDSNWIAPLGPHVDAFEREFSEEIGLSATAVSSGTAALHLSLLLANVQPGDEVLTSSWTFAATANAITYCGATPVFLDSDRATWNLDPQLLEEELESLASRGGRAKLPRAVVVVDLYGQCADYDAICQICDRFEVTLIEDAAESLGATFRGRNAGYFGHLSIFSFNGNKIITTSGGGMLCAHDARLCERAKFLATQARDPAPHYQHSHIGYNYRMSNLLAAVGRAQLRVLEARVAKRRANYAYYHEALRDLEAIEFMPEIEGGVSTRWLTCLTLNPAKTTCDRETLRIRLLEDENVETRPLWKPMHLQPVFSQMRRRVTGVSGELFDRGLCLPSGSSLTQADQERVVRRIRQILLK